MSNFPPNNVEYPRPGGTPNYSYNGRGPGVYFDAIPEAWAMVRRDLGTWVAGVLLFLVLTYAMLIPVGLLTAPLSPKDPMASDYLQRTLVATLIQSFINILPTAIMNMLMAGLIGIGVRQARGEYINISMIFEPFKRFGPNFAASLLAAAIFFASLIAFVLPAFFFYPVLILMPAVAFLKELGPKESLVTTFNACKSHWLGLLCLLFITGLVAGLGVCACCVGILFTYPIYFAVMAIHYRAFFESSYDPMAG